jgi:hypothetical protein
VETSGITSVTPIGLALILLLSILILVLPRRFAIVPMLIGAFYLTLGQQIVIASLNFTPIRVLLFFGWIRLFFRKEIKRGYLNKLDKILICWVVSSVFTYVGLRLTADALIYRLGFAYNTIGLYFMFRFLVRDLDEIKAILKTIAIIVTPLAIIMLIESTTGKNLFAVFGGVPEFSVIRDGSVRAQGAFRHPILAGSFGATMMPLFVGLWYSKGTDRRVALIGFIAATAITFASASSGPFISYVLAFIALLMWPFRKNMKLVRWSLLCGLAALALFMNAPIWYFAAHLSTWVGRGGGWYRAYLIDQFVKHIDEWWLMGTLNTAKWMPFALDENRADITSQFCAEGINGGLLTMLLFIWIIVLGFKVIGKSLRLVEDSQLGAKFMLWAFGSALFAHVVAFMSVSYFDQIIVFWYLLLAMISTVGYGLLHGSISINSTRNSAILEN